MMLNRLFGLVMCIAVLGGFLASVWVPFPQSSIYFLESGLLTAWLISDAVERRCKLGRTLMYALSALVFSPIIVPRWYANRPLKVGEVRRGGWDSNFYNAFGLVTVFFTGTSAALNFLQFGANNGFEFIVNTGFCIAGTAFVLALGTRKDTVMEKGQSIASKAFATQEERVAKREKDNF